MKIKAPPPENSIYINSTPKEILNFYNLPLTGGGEGGKGIKCSSPLVADRITCNVTSVITLTNYCTTNVSSLSCLPRVKF